MKSKISDKYLGGDDFDNKLLEHCLYPHGLDVDKEQIDKKSLLRLGTAYEQAKKILNIRNEAYIQLDNFINDLSEYSFFLKINNRLKYRNKI